MHSISLKRKSRHRGRRDTCVGDRVNRLHKLVHLFVGQGNYTLRVLNLGLGRLTLLWNVCRLGLLNGSGLWLRPRLEQILESTKLAENLVRIETRWHSRDLWKSTSKLTKQRFNWVCCLLWRLLSALSCWLWICWLTWRLVYHMDNLVLFRD